MIKFITEGERHQKAWGYEIWLHNDELYCGKILHFYQGRKFSMHFHVQKHETWYVNKGHLILKYINPKNADKEEISLYEGMVIEIPQGCPHQLIAVEESEIFEISTQHFEDDSYRVEKGDGQKLL